MVMRADQNFDLKIWLFAQTWPRSFGEPREVGKLPLDKIYISIPYLSQKNGQGANELRSFPHVAKTSKKITVASARRKIATSPGVRPNYSLSLADILRHLHKSFPSQFLFFGHLKLSESHPAETRLAVYCRPPVTRKAHLYGVASYLSYTVIRVQAKSGHNFGQTRGWKQLAWKKRDSESFLVTSSAC